MIKFIEATLSVIGQAMLLAVFFGALTAAALGLLRLIQFLAAM